MKFSRFEHLILLVASMMYFMDMIGTSILNTSFPQVAYSLGVFPIQLKVALTSYLLSLGVLMPISGWMADRFGVRRLLLWSIALFGAGALSCSFSTSLSMLVISRVFQGLGGAFLIPVGRVLILRVFGAERLLSVMMRVLAVGLVGATLGPVIGGALTTYVSWRAIFWVNPILAVIVFMLIFIYLPKRDDDGIDHPVDRCFDWPGFLSFGLGLGLLLFAVNSAATLVVAAWIKWLGVALGMGSLLYYAWHARRTLYPMLDFTVLRGRTFRQMLGGSTLFRLGSSAVPFSVPLMLQVTYHYTAMATGNMMLCIAFGGFVTRFFMASLVARLGYRPFIRWNAFFSALLMALLAWQSVDLSTWVLRVILFFYGFFVSIQFSSVNTKAFTHVDKAHHGAAASLFSTLKQIVLCFSVAMTALFLEGLRGHASLQQGLEAHYFFDLYVILTALLLLSWFVFLRISRQL